MLMLVLMLRTLYAYAIRCVERVVRVVSCDGRRVTKSYRGGA